MTREEMVVLLMQLLPWAPPATQHELGMALSEILRTTSAANVLALQRGLEGMKKERLNE